MEDREMSKAQKTNSIVDLTADMELSDDLDIDIIELTDIVDSPDEIVSPTPPVTEEPPEIEQTAPRPFKGNVFSSAIEQQVEAAFDYVQSPIDQASPGQGSTGSEKGLIDRLSDIPAMVDSALETSDAPDTEAEEAADEEMAPVDSQGLESEAPSDPAADTRILDADQSELDLDEVEEEIIELSDIVDPSEIASVNLQEEDDDEIIELTDIVDPSELLEMDMQVDDDDEIIELTDIVDPSELRVSAVIAEPDETKIEQKAASDASTDQAADIAIDDQEYEDLLEMIDTLDAEDLLVSVDPEDGGGDAGLEPVADEDIADLDAMLAVDEEASARPDEETTDSHEEDQEYADLLETIDSLDPDDLLVSIDEAGLLGSGDEGEAAEAHTDPIEDDVPTLMAVLNHNTDDKKDKPPAEEKEMGVEIHPVHQAVELKSEEATGALTQEVEEETGRKVKELTDQEVEAAVERILKSKYADVIERIIANAVEKAVNREIEIIKRAMIDGDEPLS